MARIYPKHAVPKDCADYAYEDFERAESAVSRFDPTGIDAVETYTDVYNIPHDPPQRDRR